MNKLAYDSDFGSATIWNLVLVYVDPMSWSIFVMLEHRDARSMSVNLFFFLCISSLHV